MLECVGCVRCVECLEYVGWVDLASFFFSCNEKKKERKKISDIKGNNDKHKGIKYSHIIKKTSFYDYGVLLLILVYKDINQFLIEQILFP